jgi:hypothetical protein
MPSLYNFLLRLCVYDCITQVPKYTYSRIVNANNNGGGSGWTLEGKQFFDSLQTFVKNDRIKHAPAATPATGNTMTFNKALYQQYLRRRERELTKSNGNLHEQQLKRKAPPYQCIDEFDDESDNEEQTNNSTTMDNVSSFEV